MQIIQIGSFSFDAVLLLCVVAIMAAFGWTIYQDKRQVNRQISSLKLEPWLWGILLFSLLFGRLYFVLGYWSLYQTQPGQIINIRDGGFSWVAALAAYCFGLLWIWRYRRKLLGRLLQSTGIAAVFILVGLSWLQPWRTEAIQWFEYPQLKQLVPLKASLPHKEIPFHEAKRSDIDDSSSKALAQSSNQEAWNQYQGRPLVVNLWASWCPPCRREMPVLQLAQQRYPEVHFVFVNQGEDEQVIADYLNQQNLSLKNVWMDDSAVLGQAINSSGLPSTLFIDSQGVLRKTRLGELSEASLESFLNEIRH